MALLVLLLACTAPEPGDLHAAARSGSAERISRALELGADVNLVQDDGTPLHAAVQRARPEAIKILLDKGADPKLTDPKGLTPWDLLWVKNKGFLTSSEIECAIALLEAKVEIGQPKTGGSYLHLAAQRANNARLVKLLIDSGIPIEGLDENGWTPLHLAAHESHAETAAALLSAGANSNARTTETWEETRPRDEGGFDVVFRYEAGSHPLDVARYGTGGRGEKSVQALLKEWGGTKNPAVKNRARS
jgi:ankyrin repeat protein